MGVSESVLPMRQIAAGSRSNSSSPPLTARTRYCCDNDPTSGTRRPAYHPPLPLSQVTRRAGIVKCVAREARPLLQHRQIGVSPRFEECERLVAPRHLVVTPDAHIRRMTGRARRSIERRLLAVNVISPTDRMGLRPHHLVARIALPLRRHRRCDVRVANVALRTRLPRHRLMF